MLLLFFSLLKLLLPPTSSGRFYRKTHKYMYIDRADDTYQRLCVDAVTVVVLVVAVVAAAIVTAV